MILVILPITAMESKKRGPEQEKAESKEKKQKGDKSSEIFEELRVLHKEISKEYQGKVIRECDKAFDKILELIKIRDAHEDGNTYYLLRDTIETLKQQVGITARIHAEAADNSLKAWQTSIKKQYDDIICSEDLIKMTLAEAEQQLDKEFLLLLSHFFYEKICMAARRNITNERIEEAKRFEG
jgi:hypothetical protein